ncbi:MAG: hypothetical protein V1776_02210 [Candidatus Diapherotrites archaeon]
MAVITHAPRKAPRPRVSVRRSVITPWERERIRARPPPIRKGLLVLGKPMKKNRMIYRAFYDQKQREKPVGVEVYNARTKQTTRHYLTRTQYLEFRRRLNERNPATMAIALGTNPQVLNWLINTVMHI